MTLLWLLIACANTADKAQDDTSETVSDPAADTATDTDTDTDTDTGHSAAAPDPCDASWDGWASGFFTTYCTSCHSVSSATRHGAPSGVDFDHRTDVQVWSERVRARVLDDQTMPLGGGVDATELARLDGWLQCLEDQP